MDIKDKIYRLNNKNAKNEKKKQKLEAKLKKEQAELAKLSDEDLTYFKGIHVGKLSTYKAVGYASYLLMVLGLAIGASFIPNPVAIGILSIPIISGIIAGTSYALKVSNEKKWQKYNNEQYKRENEKKQLALQEELKQTITPTVEPSLVKKISQKIEKTEDNTLIND